MNHNPSPKLNASSTKLSPLPCMQLAALLPQPFKVFLLVLLPFIITCSWIFYLWQTFWLSSKNTKPSSINDWYGPTIHAFDMITASANMFSSIKFFPYQTNSSPPLKVPMWLLVSIPMAWSPFVFPTLWLNALTFDASSPIAKVSDLLSWKRRVKCQYHITSLWRHRSQQPWPTSH